VKNDFIGAKEVQVVMKRRLMRCWFNISRPLSAISDELTSYEG
jgi:hypothetical protein